MNKPYFKMRPDQPSPLRRTVTRTVRFEEVDALGIVWHGRYPSYIEDARAALGAAYGVGYLDLYRQGVLAPIRKMHLDYFKPLVFEETFSVEGIFHWSEAARLNYEFVLRNAAGEVTTTGYSVQMLMDNEHNLLLAPPDFYQDFLRRWQKGELA